MAFAVIETGGKQYRVSPGDKIKVEKLDTRSTGSGQADKDTVIFDKVLMIVDGDKMDIGDPILKGAKVEAKILEQGREKKKIVFKYKSKTRQRTKRGHRQPFTEVEITKIG